MGLEPSDEQDLAIELVEDDDVEAVTDEREPESSLVDAPGLGVDLPEADALDQRLEVPLDDDER